MLTEQEAESLMRAITYLDLALHRDEVDLTRLLPRDGSLPLETFEARYHAAGHKVNDALAEARAERSHHI